MKDIQVMPQRFAQNVSKPPTYETLRLALLVMSGISVLCSVYFLMLDLSIVVYMFQSSQIMIGILLVVVGLIKHFCQFLWAIGFTRYHNIFAGWFALIACAGGLVVMAFALVYSIIVISKDTPNPIEVMLHPFVIEFGTFIFPSILKILYEYLHHINPPHLWAQAYYYEPVTQPMEMQPISYVKQPEMQPISYVKPQEMQPIMYAKPQFQPQVQFQPYPYAYAAYP